MDVDHIEIAKLELGPGDVLVVRAPDHYPTASIHNAVNFALEKAGVKGVPILIGPPDIEFQVIRKSDDSTPPQG